MKKKRKLELVYQGPGGGGEEEAGVIYRRVSTPGQEEGTSLQTQKENTLKLAHSLGIVVAEEHDILEVWTPLTLTGPAWP